LLVHVADHTQRHVGQAVITAKVLVAEREQKNVVVAGEAKFLASPN